MTHPIQCQCGTFRAQLEGEGPRNRLMCYCTDCRAYARFLGQDTNLLDPQGGTEVVQVAQSRLRLLQGEDRLVAMRLSDKGMVRWYTRCCRTPMGNTMADPKAAFIGLIHSCLDRSRMDEDFGTTLAVVNTDTALGTPKPQQRGLLGVIARFMWMMVRSRISGDYRQSPLFDAAGLPRVAPTVLSAAELASLKQRDSQGSP